MTLEKIPQHVEGASPVPQTRFADTALAQNLAKCAALAAQAKAAVPPLPEGDIVQLAHKFYIDPADNPIRRFAREAHANGAVHEARSILWARVNGDKAVMGLFNGVVQALEHQTTPDGVIDERIKPRKRKKAKRSSHKS